MKVTEEVPFVTFVETLVPFVLTPGPNSLKASQYV